jgi:EAL domain-containing protein (putative c-di-GMP-specific phosphodiesterase class I)
MLEISEDQKLDLNSGAQQRLLALEQLSFTLAMDDDGNGYSGLQRLRIPLNLRCRLGQKIRFSKPFQAEQLDHLAQDRRKDLIKAVGTLAGKTAAAGAVADVESCRPGEPSQQTAEIRTA